MGSQFGDLRGNCEFTVGLLRMTFEVVFVLSFSAVEDFERQNLRHQWCSICLGILQLFNKPLRCCSLLGIVVEDDRSILSADVSPLAVWRGRIVRRKENLEDCSERDGLRVKRELDDLSMACGS